MASTPTPNPTPINSSMIVPINNLLTRGEIVKILYSNAINGSGDSYTIFGSSKKIDLLIIVFFGNACEDSQL